MDLSLISMRTKENSILLMDMSVRKWLKYIKKNCSLNENTLSTQIYYAIYNLILHELSVLNRKKIMILLKNYYCNSNLIIDKNLLTIIFLHCCNIGFIDIIKILIVKGFYIPDTKYHIWKDPIYLSSVNNHIDIIELLIKVGYQPFKNGYQCIKHAIIQEKHEAVVYLLDFVRLPVLFKNLSALASKQGNLKSMNCIINRIQNNNKALYHLTCIECLEIACENGHLNIVKYFQDIIPNINNHPLLEIASIHNQYDVVQYLINTYNHSLDTIQHSLLFSCQNYIFEIPQLLFEHYYYKNDIDLFNIYLFENTETTHCWISFIEYLSKQYIDWESFSKIQKIYCYHKNNSFIIKAYHQSKHEKLKVESMLTSMLNHDISKHILEFF